MNYNSVMQHVRTYNSKCNNSVNLCVHKYHQPLISTLICDSRAITTNECCLSPTLSCFGVILVPNLQNCSPLFSVIFLRRGKTVLKKHNRCFCQLFCFNNPKETRMHFEHNCHSDSNEKCLKMRIESSILYFFLLQLFVILKCESIFYLRRLHDSSHSIGNKCPYFDTFFVTNDTVCIM